MKCIKFFNLIETYDANYSAASSPIEISNLFLAFESFDDVNKTSKVASTLGMTIFQFHRLIFSSEYFETWD